MVVLAVGAHPDDLESACGGTLAKYSRLGNKVFMVHASNGNVGHRVIPPEELAAIRAEEARKAGALIGAEVIYLGGRDLYVRSEDMELRNKLVDIIRYSKPDIIITHNPDDYMDDHNETSKLVFEASMAATVTHLHTDHEFYGKLTPIYYMEKVAGINSSPTEFVDISEDIETKLKMLSQHESQLKWAKEHDNIDFLETARVFSRFRGYQCNVAYAEGFTYCMQFHKMPVKRYLP
ncbi:MAG: PIG-L family deacetylase [Treponema sp.]|jgi:LmbE family N-acetylglucosaminyl deacetylase|nr:PIG-L family deacetylase [Treponema sp.]